MSTDVYDMLEGDYIIALDMLDPGPRELAVLEAVALLLWHNFGVEIDCSAMAIAVVADDPDGGDAAERAATA